MSSAQPQHEHRGLRGRLAGLFSSAFSQNGNDEQIAKLMEELQRQKDLKETYKARLESTQGYLRFCIEVAQEHGFLHIISDNAQQQCSPHRDAEAEPASTTDDDDVVEGDEQAEKSPCDPYLLATRNLAEQHGWSVAPDEIELHEVIGHGTTADIHRATWRGLEVAVKWVRPEFFRSNPSGEAFVAQELDVLSRQRHPHVLRLMGACLRPPESCFLVTELLRGATLGEWLHGGRERRPRRASPPPLADRVSRALEIALAMRYLHEQTPRRVVHRDLKPSNVLLGADLRARIADFGHARFLLDGKEALTGETGTYVYMAPEVIRCEPYTEKCDVYSFGIILNELITAEHPYIDTSYGPSKIALEVAAGKLRPKLPESDACLTGLTDLICRSWDAEPSNRPSFAIITLMLHEIRQQIVQQGEQNLYSNHL